MNAKTPTHAKDIIRACVAKVEALRDKATASTALVQAVSEVKAFQSRRFMGSYADLLQTKQYKPATLFFLNELYSEKDYSERDAQFARIAGALERLFPDQVVQTAVALAQLHCLTEELDQAMAKCWMKTKPSKTDTLQIERYQTAWLTVGRRKDRDAQLQSALAVGQELIQLTRMPGLRMALKLMRGPAHAAGMAALQHFLESGFDTFAAMGKEKDGTDFFLQTVSQREAEMIDVLFDASFEDSQIAVEKVLTKAKK